MTGKMAEGIGRRIAKFRKAAGLTQEQVGNRLDVALETISRMERGVSTPSIKTLERIANLLGVSIADFFASEVGPSEREKLLDELVTKLRRRHAREVQLVSETADHILGYLDRNGLARGVPHHIEFRPKRKRH